MRPEDFKIPNFRTTGGPLYHDRLLFLPRKKFNEEPSPNSTQRIDFGAPPYFETARPIALEYCSGNGQWICERALQEPEKNWIGLERKMDRARKIWSKSRNNSLDNLLCLAAEALHATQELFSDHSVSEVYINFPDPWPKKRHHKNRLFQPLFIQELARVMKNGAPLMVATDSAELSEVLIEEILSNSAFRSKLCAPHFVTEWPGYGNSYFETLWQEQGRILHYHLFEKYV